MAQIRNFRKLRNCRIDFEENQTIFVGANNSGKTSAMSAIIWFLKGKYRFITREFTLTNWMKINELADKWLVSDEADPILLTPNQWDDIVPSLDIWIDVAESEAYQVYKMIPSLTWKKDSVGVRLRFEPKFLLVFILESFQCFRFLFCYNIQINHCGMEISHVRGDMIFALCSYRFQASIMMSWRNEICSHLC